MIQNSWRSWTYALSLVTKEIFSIGQTFDSEDQGDSSHNLKNNYYKLMSLKIVMSIILSPNLIADIYWS